LEARGREAYLKQYGDRLSGETAGNPLLCPLQRVNSGVSAIAVEAFMDNPG
jgi:hypothetical protein